MHPTLGPPAVGPDRITVPARRDMLRAATAAAGAAAKAAFSYPFAENPCS